MPRLFTGIELPDDIRASLERLRAPLPGARWLAPSDLHITLRFAGDVDNLVASEFAAGLASIETAAFEARVAGLGAFGGNTPRVLWAGIEAGPELEALARANERAARAAGLPPEKHAFKAHVSLARLQHTKPEVLARYLERNGAFASTPFTVDHFVLYSARPQTGGGPYVVEEVYALAGAYGNSDDAYDARW